jgi:hypothetical protein
MACPRSVIIHRSRGSDGSLGIASWSVDADTTRVSIATLAEAAATVCLQLFAGTVWLAICIQLPLDGGEFVESRTRIASRARYGRRYEFIFMLAVGLCTTAKGQGIPPVTITCGVDHLQLAPVRTSANFTAVLAMHSADDHSKETHLCQTEYTLQITRPDGSSMHPFEFGVSDDVWERPLAFRIDGFSEDGHRAFIFLSEGAYPQAVEALEYDMDSGRPLSDVFLSRRFTKSVGRECAATLHIVGTSGTGRMLLRSNTDGGCSHRKLWELPADQAAAKVHRESPKAIQPAVVVHKLEQGKSTQQ